MITDSFVMHETIRCCAKWTIWPKEDVASLIGHADVTLSTRKLTIIVIEMLIGSSVTQVIVQITLINAHYYSYVQIKPNQESRLHFEHAGII